MSRSIDEYAPFERQAIDRLVVKHLPATLRFAQRLTGDADLAEDLVQETLCRVLRRWRSYRGEAEFSTWMMQIVVNVDRDRRRSLRPLQELPPEQADIHQTEPNEKIAAAELDERIRSIVQNLPDRQREVALLCLGEELDANQAAEILQTSVANIHTCLHLARKRIAKTLGLDCP